MTDNEIKKALECCKYSIYEKHCVDCLLMDEPRCIEYVTKAALDLINRQEEEAKSLQAEVENYKQIAEHQQSVTMDRGFEIKRLKEEIERLKSVLPEKSGVFTVVENAIVYTKTIKDYDSFLKKVSTEAYKECIEKVKKLWGNYRGYDFERKLYNLLNELVGDANETY